MAVRADESQEKKPPSVPDVCEWCGGHLTATERRNCKWPLVKCEACGTQYSLMDDTDGTTIVVFSAERMVYRYKGDGRIMRNSTTAIVNRKYHEDAEADGRKRMKTPEYQAFLAKHDIRKPGAMA